MEGGESDVDVVRAGQALAAACWRHPRTKAFTFCGVWRRSWGPDLGQVYTTLAVLCVLTIITRQMWHEFRSTQQHQSVPVQVDHCKGLPSGFQSSPPALLVAAAPCPDSGSFRLTASLSCTCQLQQRLLLFVVRVASDIWEAGSQACKDTCGLETSVT